MDILPTRSKAIAEYRLQNPTLNQQEIANHFGVTPGRISQVLNSIAVRQHYPILARRRVENTMLPLATQAYEELLAQKDNLAVREKASQVILRETGVFDVPTVKIEASLTFERVREIQEFVQKAAADASPILDAEVISESDNPPV